MSEPRFCWHCGKKLLPAFAEVTDPIGNVHRVHKACQKDAEQSLAQFTADPDDGHGEDWKRYHE